MKITTKRQRSDSAKAAVQAAENVAMPLLMPPPWVKLKGRDLDYYEVIVKARPRDTWVESDLCLAAMLANVMADCDVLRENLSDNGLIVEGKANPAFELLEKSTRRVMALARQLKVDTISTVGKAQDIHKGAELERQARGDAAADPLIPTRPH